MSPKAKVTAADIVQALRDDYKITDSRLEMEEWSLLVEVPLRVRHPHATAATDFRITNERTIDVLMLRNWGGLKSESFERLAVEVKVTKGDFRNETDRKREPAWANAHRCAYACPAEMLTPAEMPDGWGLLWVYPEPRSDVPTRHRDFGKRTSWRATARRHEPTGDDVRLMHTLARRAARAEERLRRGDCPASEMAAMRVEVDRLHARLANRDHAIFRQRERAREALQRLRVLGEQRCADCGEVVKPNTHVRSLDYRQDGFWNHADKAAGDRCRMARSEAVRLSREQTTSTRYTHHRDYAGPVETASEREERERDWERERAEDDAYAAITTDDDHREEARYG